MITMDAKGITWVGCVYQKFESMCLEVEENMYEDTVKFVENQVQTVGASVKKFYADVMQDLLSESSLDPENKSACGFPVEHHSDVDNFQKSKISKKGGPLRVDVEQLNGDSEVMAVDKDVDHTSVFHQRHRYDSCTLSSGDCVKEVCFDLYSRHDHDGNIYPNTNLVVKETPIKDRLSQAITPVEKDLSRVSSSFREIVNEIHEVSCDQSDTVITPSTAEGMACDSIRETCVIANASQCTADLSIDFQSSDMIVLDKSDGNKWKEMLDLSFGGFSAESNVADTCLNNGVVSLVGSSPNGQGQYEKYADKEFFASHPGESHKCSLDATESDTVSEHRTEAIQQSDKAKLEETCVIVTGEELPFVHHMEGIRRPHKKKIHKAFASRMRSARKQEYEQLALWYGDHAKSNLKSGEGQLHSLTMEETMKSPDQDFCESEWEIL